MSLYEKATLVQIPSGYKASSAKLYSIVPSDGDGDFTVTADTNATRVNAEGLIEDTAANQARLSRNFIDGELQPDPFLLLEPTRTNLQVRSEEFDNAAWTKSNCTVSANQTTSPDGATTADKIIENSGSGSKKVYDSITTSSGTEYTWSVFLKADTRSKARLNIFGAYAEFDVANQTLLTESGITSYKIEDYGNGWGRFSITETANATSTLTYVYLLDDAGNVSYTGDGVSGLFAFGAQLEVGTYPTSYIPTSGSVVERLQGEFENSFTGLTSTVATIFLDFETKGLDYNFGRLFAVHDSVTSDGIYLGIYSTNTIGFFGIDGGSGLPDVKDTISFNERNKLVLAFDGSGNYKYSLNGSLKTGTYTGTSRQYDEVGRGNVIGGSSNNIQIHQLMIFNEVLSDIELETLTSYTSFNQMAKALLYTIE